MRHLPDSLRFALIGWLGGTAATVILGLVWPFIFPAIVNVENYYAAGPGLLTIILMIVAWSAPAAIVGGLIGGRLSVEGGSNSQRLFAILLGIILAIPCATMGYWFFTGE